MKKPKRKKIPDNDADSWASVLRLQRRLGRKMNELGSSLKTFYHVTNRQAARAILKRGFRDNRSGGFAHVEGVWISEVPLSCNEGAKGDIILEIKTRLTGQVLNRFEVVEVGKPYREWCVPGRFLAKSRIRIIPDEE